MVRRLLSLLLLLAVVVNASASERTLTVAYVDFPPFLFQNATGEADGTFVNLTRRVAREAGYQLEFQLLPAARAYYYLKLGQIDLWLGLVNNPSFDGLVLESKARPILTEYGLWHLSDTPAPGHFRDLDGKLLITIGGYNYEGLAQLLEQRSSVTSVSTSNHHSALDMLVRQRGEYLLDYRAPVLQELKTFPVQGIHYTPMKVREAAWLFPVSGEHARERVQAFDEAWQRLLERGEVTAPQRPQQLSPMAGMPRLPD